MTASVVPPDLQQQVFRRLNAVLEPAIRLGFLNPGPWPTGLVVMEVTGRKSGRQFRVPAFATWFGRLALVSTVRGDSQWMKNLAAVPETAWWQWGQRWPARATVVSGGLPAVVPEGCLAGALVRALAPVSAATGVQFALLEAT